jgi:hypothetical protein
LVCRLLESRQLEVWSLELVQRWGGGIHMNKGRVGEDRGSKETDGYPLTSPVRSVIGYNLQNKMVSLSFSVG